MQAIVFVLFSSWSNPLLEIRARDTKEQGSFKMARNIGSDQFHLNEWIADHLAERGYAATLRAFRSDVKNDKTSSVSIFLLFQTLWLQVTLVLQVDTFVEFLMNCVGSLNFQNMIEIWQDMDKRLVSLSFSRLIDCLIACSLD
jgi:hypothetical protein